MDTESQNQLTLRLLGEPRITRDGRSLSEALAGKEQALLIYLASNPGKRFSRDHLATLFWGETTQERARYNLRRALWHLREALDEARLSADEVVSSEDSRVWMPASAPCWLDTRQFEDALEAALRHLQAEFSPASRSVHRIRETIDLYRGDFLAGFSVSQATDFDHWILTERERFFQLLLRALGSLIQSFIAWGERDEAIDVCRRLLKFDPVQEDTHRLLMRLYWDTGRRTEALRQYRTCREILRRELDMEPVAETRDLHERILQNEVSPASISSLTLTSRLALPRPAPEALARPRLFSLLDDGLRVPLTLVSAPPGYGKTTLAAQWVRSRSNQERDPPALYAWYRLSETDDIPFTLIEGLATCLTRQRPVLGHALRDIYSLSASQGDPRHAAGLLIQALTSLDRVTLALILDDVELLAGPESQKTLRFLLSHLPRNIHVYILTRVDPELPLGRMRVRGDLLEVRQSELRMTEEETERFLDSASGPKLTGAEISQLTSLAEGWAAPLWLAANARGRFAASLDDVWEALFAYLRQEVLAPLPVALGDFLLRTAILNRLTPTVCRSLLSNGEEDGQAAAGLAELRHRNLFLRRIAAGGPQSEPRYAFHPLFRRFLRTELPYHFSRAEIEALHRRAGQAWEALGDADEARFHREQAGSPGCRRIPEAPPNPGE